jgi:hypothetical protein
LIKKRGRKVKPVEDDVAMRILEEYDQGMAGVRKTIRMLRAKGTGISGRDCEKVWDRADLYRFRMMTVPVVPRSRYCACQRNLIWHVDLKELKPGQYPEHIFFVADMEALGAEQEQPAEGQQPRKYWLIIFLDDASRLIMGGKVIIGKKSRTTADFLVQTVQKCGTQPYCVWTDCGGEFRKDFESELEDRGMRHFTTRPRNPQANGKSGRLWRSVTDRMVRGCALEESIAMYNRVTHDSLPEVVRNGCRSRFSPEERYAELPEWGMGPGESSWVVNGTEHAFPRERTE